MQSDCHTGQNVIDRSNKIALTTAAGLLEARGEDIHVAILLNRLLFRDADGGEGRAAEDCTGNGIILCLCLWVTPALTWRFRCLTIPCDAV